MKLLLVACAGLLAGCVTPTLAPRVAPLVDYHQHLVSAAFEPLVKLPQRDGAALVRDLDAAGIDRAVVLSVAYTYGDERKPIAERDRDRMTSEENDWTSAQVMANAPRLIGFCSANPLRAQALKELDRCLGLPGMAGIKLHLGNGGISLRNPDHVKRMSEVFALAERRRAPVLLHMRARGGTDYGAPDARIFIEKLMPLVPDCQIIVAHLGVAGPGWGDQGNEVMTVFGEAAKRSDKRVRNLYFDVATDVTEETTPAEATLIAQRIREVGASHILYGSDLSPPGGSVRSGWEIFRSKVPLAPAELRTIINNRLEFVR